MKGYVLLQIFWLPALSIFSVDKFCSKIFLSHALNATNKVMYEVSLNSKLKWLHNIELVIDFKTYSVSGLDYTYMLLISSLGKFCTKSVLLQLTDIGNKKSSAQNSYK